MIPAFQALAHGIPARPSEVSPLEEELVAGAQREDGRAFRALFDLHAPAVHRFLRDLLGGDPAAADEATQETFVRVHQRMRKLRPGQPFRPWALGIARNVFREQTRRRRRWFSLFAPLEEGRSSEPNGDSPVREVAETFGRDPRTPESALIARETTAQIELALQRLSADRRAALLLRFDHGLSCAEVAGILGWSVPKVKVEVHRARLALRADLEQLPEDRS